MSRCGWLGGGAKGTLRGIVKNRRARMEGKNYYLSILNGRKYCDADIIKAMKLKDHLKDMLKKIVVDLFKKNITRNTLLN